MMWTAMQPMRYDDQLAELLGFLPIILSEDDPRPTSEQLNDRYRHGGGWQPFHGFVLLDNGDLKYPGDPPIKPLAQAMLHKERLVFYEHEWLMIMQPDGSWEIGRVD